VNEGKFCRGMGRGDKLFRTSYECAPKSPNEKEFLGNADSEIGSLVVAVCFCGVASEANDVMTTKIATSCQELHPTS